MAAFNQVYVDNATLSIEFATSCNQLADFATQVTNTLTEQFNSVTLQYNQISAQLEIVQQDAIDLYDQIAAIAGWQASQEALTIQLGTASALSASNVAGIVSYLQAQASAMVTVNNTSLATIVKQLLVLNASYQALQRDITKLTNQVSTLEEQLTKLPESIASIASAAETAAEKFVDCVITIPPLA